jgi:hypothetical protein
MKARNVQTVEQDGKTIVRVPLGRSHDKFAEIEQDDFDFLTKLGVSPNWNRLAPRDYVTASARTASGSHIQIARVLLNAGPGEGIKYGDGNPLNLRRENLKVAESKGAIRRDRDFVTGGKKYSIA